ncbi:MAG: AarF/UbiB family protein [Sphingobium sp.]
MIKTLMVAARDRNRLNEILQIASRFGLGILLDRLGLGRTDGDGDGDKGEDRPDLPRRTRLALEELGPTFVKLGQILGTRSDILPPEWIAELEKLHSKAPTLAFQTLRPAVEEALGQPPEEAFATFDAQPIAAASMAQVHRATLLDGRPVVLKIRRPGIRPRMEADLRLIAQLAAVVERASAEARRFAPVAMVRQLAEAVLEELDFTSEGRNGDRLRADFAGEPRVIVPEVHWAWTTETLLVMDYVDGIAPRNGSALLAAGIDPRAIAALGADMVLDMVLINGRFHGDPHPGNLLCLPGNHIALLDLGLIGHVSPRRREEFIGFVQALTGKDPAQLADVLATWSAGSGVPRARITSAAERLITRHGGGQLRLSAMVSDFFQLMRADGMTMPPDLLLIFKALVTIDGVLTAIQPDFDLSEAMQRSSLRLVEARLSPAHWAPIVQAIGWEFAKIGNDAPRLIRAAIRRLEDEPAEVASRQGSGSAGRWICASILIGSLMIAGSILMS